MESGNHFFDLWWGLMAHIRLDPNSGHYFLRFRYGGTTFNRSLKTGDHREAIAIKGRVTGHQAFFTQDAMEAIATTTLKNLSEIEETGRSENEVTSQLIKGKS